VLYSACQTVLFIDHEKFILTLYWWLDKLSIFFRTF